MKPRVLVVEDDRIVSRVVGEMLADLECLVQLADSGEEGLERFSQGIFDLVVSDVNMPGIDGIEMIRQMRAVDPTVVSIVMTSRQDQQVAVRALEAGVHCFLTKPFAREKLQEKVEEAIAERERVVETRLMIGDLFKLRANLQQEIELREEKLTSMERYLQHLLDAAPFGILSTDQEGQILTFNRGAERIYGYRSGEIIGRNLSLLIGRVKVHAETEKAYHLHQSGERFPVLLHCRDIIDSRDERIAHLYVVEDRREREQLEAQLVSAERLSALGEMAPRIAHEFKTPLQLILGHAELALLWLKDEKTGQAQQAVERILPAVNQMHALVQQIANLGKPQESKEVDLDLRRELEKVMEPLQHLGVVKHCRVEWEVDKEVPLIHGDPAQIEQLLRNLVVNAAQAMERTEERLLTLGVRSRSRGREVEVSVRDTGPGIPAELQDQIFQPFFTTKTKGTGLGLSIVKMVVERHGGRIQVSGHPGKGACFAVILPAAHPAGPAPSRVRKAAEVLP